MAGALGEAEELGDAVHLALEPVPRDPPRELFCPLAERHGLDAEEQALLMTDAVWDAADKRVVSERWLRHLPCTRTHPVGSSDPQVRKLVALTKERAVSFQAVQDARDACNMRETVLQNKLAAAVDKLNRTKLVPVILPTTSNIRVRYVDLATPQDQQEAVWAARIGKQKAIAQEEETRLKPKVAEATKQLADQLKRAWAWCRPAEAGAASLKRLKQLEATVRAGARWRDVSAALDEAITVMRTEAAAPGGNDTHQTLLKRAYESVAKEIGPDGAAAADAFALDRVRDEIKSTTERTIENMVLRCAPGRPLALELNRVGPTLAGHGCRWESIISRRVDQEVRAATVQKEGAGWDGRAVLAFASEEVKALAQE